jgi:hypothetical protein
VNGTAGVDVAVAVGEGVAVAAAVAGGVGVFVGAAVGGEVGVEVGVRPALVTWKGAAIWQLHLKSVK